MNDRLIEGILRDTVLTPSEYCGKHGISDDDDWLRIDMCSHLVGRTVAVMRHKSLAQRALITEMAVDIKKLCDGQIGMKEFKKKANEHLQAIEKEGLL